MINKSESNIVYSECRCSFNISNNYEFLTNRIKCKNYIKEVCLLY